MGNNIPPIGSLRWCARRAMHLIREAAATHKKANGQKSSLSREERGHIIAEVANGHGWSVETLANKLNSYRRVGNKGRAPKAAKKPSKKPAKRHSVRATKAALAELAKFNAARNFDEAREHENALLDGSRIAGNANDLE